jgi:hypothetical protein
MSLWKGGKRRNGGHDICAEKAGAEGKRSRVVSHRDDAMTADCGVFEE